MPRGAKHPTEASGRTLLDYAGAARYLATTERHVRRLWNERKLSAVKVGKLVRFDPADLDAFIQKSRIEATN